MMKRLMISILVLTSLLMGLQSMSFAAEDDGASDYPTNVDHDCTWPGGAVTSCKLKQACEFWGGHPFSVNGKAMCCEDDVHTPGGTTCTWVSEFGRPSKVLIDLSNQSGEFKTVAPTPKSPSLRDRMKGNKAKLPVAAKTAPVAPVKKATPAAKLKKLMKGRMPTKAPTSR